MHPDIAPAGVSQDGVELQTFNSRVPEPSRVEQQPGAVNAVDAVTPLELTGPRRLKLASAALCFFNAGINDGSLGALVPYILRYASSCPRTKL